MTDIPNAFGGFAPFPNTIMIPTMGLQSAVIGYRFGFGYEQGKRSVRKMSNEEFNTLDEEAEQLIFKRHDTAAINYFRNEMVNWVQLQTLIIEKSVEIETMKAKRTPSALREIFEGFTSGFSTQQKDDAGKFFAGINDTLLKIMAWFSTGQQTTVQTTSTGQPVGTTTEITRNRSGTTETTRDVFAGETFSRTLAEAQADTSRSRGTGIIPLTPIVLPKAGQTQKLARTTLENKLKTAVINTKRKEQGSNYVLHWGLRVRQILKALNDLIAKYRW